MLHKLKKCRNTIGRCQRFSRQNHHICRIEHRTVYRLLKSVHNIAISTENKVNKIASHFPISDEVVQMDPSSNNPHAASDSSPDFGSLNPEDQTLLNILQQKVAKQKKIYEEAIAKAEKANAEIQMAQGMIDFLLRNSKEDNTQSNSIKKRTDVDPEPNISSPPKRRPPPADESANESEDDTVTSRQVGSPSSVATETARQSQLTQFPRISDRGYQYNSALQGSGMAMAQLHMGEILHGLPRNLNQHGYPAHIQHNNVSQQRQTTMSPMMGMNIQPHGHVSVSTHPGIPVTGNNLPPPPIQYYAMANQNQNGMDQNPATQTQHP